jgi:hypothetical protein
MNELVILLPGILTAVIEVFKRAMGESISHRFLPLIAVILGAVAGHFLGDIVFGVLSGLASVGLYDLTKKTGIDTVKSILK